MREEMMEDTKDITGRFTDVHVRERVAEMASRLCPIKEADARMAYATLILGWVLRGESPNARYARLQSAQRAYNDHMADVTASQSAVQGMAIRQTMLYPDFEATAERVLEFIGGGS